MREEKEEKEKRNKKDEDRGRERVFKRKGPKIPRGVPYKKSKYGSSARNLDPDDFLDEDY